MKIAYTNALGRGDTDRLMEQTARTLMADGVNLCGTVQINTDCGDGPCDMDVLVLPNGPTIRISQSLGKNARGCRLDSSALGDAVGHTSAALNAGAQGVIINKFGKTEADGNGFRDVIAQAIALDLPVLVGVNGLNEPALLEFSGGIAEKLDPKVENLTRWFQGALSRN